MQKYEYVIKPQIAKIESTKEHIPYFSFGETLDQYSESSSPSRFKMYFDVLKDFSHPTKNTQKFHFYRGNYGKDDVYYERPLGLGIKLKMQVKDLQGEAKITINNAYYKFVRFKADNVYPPGVHLMDIASVNLLERGYSPIHCAAVSREDEGTLLAAPPDTGKTITTLLALKRGFHFLAEDIAFIDREYIYANPHTSTFVHNNEFGNYQRSDWLFSISNKIPLLGYYVRPKMSVSNFMKNYKIEEKARIKNIFILDRGEKSIEKIDAEDAVRRLLIINRNEFTYHKNPLLFAYSYFNPVLNINKLMNMEESIIQAIVDKTDSFLLKTEDPRDYIHLIIKAMNGK